MMHIRSRRMATILSALFLCCLWTGCAGRQGDVAPSDDSGCSAAETLPQVQVAEGQSVHVAVTGGDPTFNTDMESMLTAYLQSERGLVPAESDTADLLVRVRVEQIYPLGTRNAPIQAGKALGLTTTGAVLGALVGSSVGGRYGSAWGVGTGALMGLGLALLDDSGKYKAWGMNALVGVGKGCEPAENAMNHVSVKAEGASMGKEEILPALEDSLSRVVVGSLRP